MALIVCVYVYVCRLWEGVFMQMRLCGRTRKSSKHAAGWAISHLLNATLCSCSEKHMIHQTERAELKENQILLTNKSNVNTQEWSWIPVLQPLMYSRKGFNWLYNMMPLQEGFLLKGTFFFFLSLKQDIYVCTSTFTHPALPCAFKKKWQMLVIFVLRHWFTSLLQLACQAKTRGKKKMVADADIEKSRICFWRCLLGTKNNCFAFKI